VPDARPADFTDDDFCYVTTTGRRSGQPHTIEIWFATNADTVYLLSGDGDRADWLRNLRADPVVGVRIADQEWEARARVVIDPDEDARARRLLAAKYQDWRAGEPLSGWAQTALAVAIEVSSSGGS
jgi:deazaflavin-dependent oxidoreductase (nitroreductase family)